MPTSTMCRRRSERRKAKRPPGTGRPFANALGERLLLAAAQHAFELLVEARQAAAAVHQLLLTAGPGRVGGRVDVQRELLAGVAPGRAGLVGLANVQADLDKVVVGVDALFHGESPLIPSRKPGLIGKASLESNPVVMGPVAPAQALLYIGRDKAIGHGTLSQ